MTEQQTEPMKAHELAYRLGIMMSAGDHTFTVRYYDSTVPFMVVDTGDEIFTLMIYGPSPKVTEAEFKAATVAAEAAGAKAAAGKDTGQKAGESTRADFVAYLNPGDSSVVCREHGKGISGLVPVTSDELPDGGVCTWLHGTEFCGRDVLIEPRSEARSPYWPGQEASPGGQTIRLHEADVLMCANVQAGTGGCLLDHGHDGECEFPAAVHPVGQAVVSIRPPFCAQPYRDDIGGMFCAMEAGHDGPHGQAAE